MHIALPEMRAGFVVEGLLAPEKWEPRFLGFCLVHLGFLFVFFFFKPCREMDLKFKS